MVGPRWITILVSVRAETVSGQPTRHAGPSISQSRGAPHFLQDDAVLAREDAERTRHAIAWARSWRACHPRQSDHLCGTRSAPLTRACSDDARRPLRAR